MEKEDGKYRLNLHIDHDVIPMLDELAGGERKRGAMIAQLVRSAYAGKQSDADWRTASVEALRLMTIATNGRVMNCEAEIMRLEKQVATLISQR